MQFIPYYSKADILAAIMQIWCFEVMGKKMRWEEIQYLNIWTNRVPPSNFAFGNGKWKVSQENANAL